MKESITLSTAIDKSDATKDYIIYRIKDLLQDFTNNYKLFLIDIDRHYNDEEIEINITGYNRLENYE